MEYTLESLAVLTGATPGEIPDRRRRLTHVATDSRSRLSDPAATVFFALRTPSNDGHRFVGDLYARGVRVFVVDADVNLPADAVVLHVDSALKALQRLGADARRRSRATVVAVTGTRGKTVVKEWLNTLLRTDRSVVRSPRSFNSQLGVPLSLLKIEPETDLAVIEAGISRPGEMTSLEEMISPDIVVFTGVDGTEHAANFASRDEQIRQKLLLAANAACLIYPQDEYPDIQRFLPDGATPRLVGVAADEPLPRVPFALKDCEKTDLRLALAAADVLKASPASIEAGLERLERPNTAIRVIDAVNGATLVYDPFTPDVESLETALDYARRRTEPGRRLSVALGEMVDGDKPETWQRVGALCAQAGVDRLLLYVDADNAALALGVGDNPLDIQRGPQEPVLDNGSTLLAFGRGFEDMCTRFEERRHQTVLRVNLDALARNFRALRAAGPQGTRMVCMVKAFGYGAGGYQLARTLEDAGADYLAVAAVDEGIDLRRAGIEMPVIVLNPRLDDYTPLLANRLEPAVYSLALLETIIGQASRAGLSQYPIHLKLDTGMHRVGLLPDELDAAAAMLATPEAVKAVRVASVFSHLATADDPAEDAYTLAQIHAFEDDCRRLRNVLPAPSTSFLAHILNSAGLLRFPQYAFDMVRVGIALYGYNPVPDVVNLPLEPVSTLSSVIIALRRWAAGTTIGYNRRGRLLRDSVIATVPIGYADGIDRRLGYGALKVDVAGVACPTVGTVCMDLMMIDVTDAVERLGADAVRVGDSVTIFGSPAPITADEVAEELRTIPYEILTSVSPRVKRVYCRE